MIYENKKTFNKPSRQQVLLFLHVKSKNKKAEAFGSLGFFPISWLQFKIKEAPCASGICYAQQFCYSREGRTNVSITVYAVGFNFSHVENPSRCSWELTVLGEVLQMTQQPTHFRGEDAFAAAWCGTALNTNLLLTVCSSSVFLNQCVYNFT